jgi:hypothetical protein
MGRIAEDEAMSEAVEILKRGSPMQRQAESLRAMEAACEIRRWANNETYGRLEKGEGHEGNRGSDSGASGKAGGD